MADYMEKIRSLLALAERETTNEHEAKDALLKARRIMAKHKISERDLNPVEDQIPVRLMTGIEYSARRDPWMSDLAHVIAEHHCCGRVSYHIKGRQLREIGIIGFPEDAEICRLVFAYAVDCIHSKTKKLKKDRGTRVADGYGFGFVMGLKEAYHKQQNEEGWGLVLVRPKAVNDIMSGIKPKSNKAMADRVNQASTIAMLDGMADGRKFNERKRITGQG